MLASGLVGAELDEASLHLTMNVRYVPGSRTFFRGIRRLAPGHVARVRRRAGPAAALRGHRLDAGQQRQPRRVDGGDPAPLRRGGQAPAAVRRAGRGVAVRRHRLEFDRGHAAARPRAGRSRRSASGSTSPRTRPSDARFVAQHVRDRAPGSGAARAGPGPPGRRHPAHRGAQGQLAAAVPAAPVHRRARVGGAVRAGRRRAVRRLRLLQLPAPRSASCAAARPAPRSARLAPALDWSARRGRGPGPARTRPGHPQTRVAGRPDGARNYLLLRNAWDFNPALLRRVYTPEFARAGSTAPAWDDYDAYFADDRPLESQALRAEFATKMVSRPAAQRGHHVDGALGGVPRAPARPRAGQVRRAHPGRHPLRRRSQGAAQGRTDRRCCRTGCCTSGNGDSLSILSSSTRRTWGPWPGACCHRTGCVGPGCSTPQFVAGVCSKATAASAPAMALFPALADDRRRDLARDVRPDRRARRIEPLEGA